MALDTGGIEDDGPESGIIVVAPMYKQFCSRQPKIIVIVDCRVVR